LIIFVKIFRPFSLIVLNSDFNDLTNFILNLSLNPSPRLGLARQAIQEEGSYSLNVYFTLTGDQPAG